MKAKDWKMYVCLIVFLYLCSLEYMLHKKGTARQPVNR